MTSAAAQTRFTALLAEADSAVKANDLKKASDALREASSLQPTNEDVKKQWLALQSTESGQDVVGLLRAYVSGQDEKQDRQRVLDSLTKATLSAADTATILQFLDQATGSKNSLDSITETLLLRQVSARTLIASALIDKTTETFEQLWRRGTSSFKALITILLDKNIFEDGTTQSKVQKGVFRLCITKIKTAGVDDRDQAMTGIARLLSIAPQNLAPVLDQDTSDMILSSLDIRFNDSVRSQAILAAAKMLEATSEKGGQMFTQFVSQRVARQTKDNLIVAFSAAAVTFPLIPVVASKLFLTEGFVQQLVQNLEGTSASATIDQSKTNAFLEEAALELLSAACVEKTCREAIDQHCAEWLKDLSKRKERKHKTIATLILAKINTASENEVTDQLSSLVLQTESDIRLAIEGLAYTSLRPEVKEKLAANDPLLKKMVNDLTKKSATVFGSLTVFANLTSYRPAQTEEQKKISQLKAYANQTKPVPLDPLDNNTFVTARCKKVLNHDLVASLVAYCKTTTSTTNISLVVRILFSLSQDQKHRPKMAQQGAVKLLLQIRGRMTNVNKTSSDTAVIERQACHTLARILISVNPAHVFSSSLPAVSAVGALAPLLSNDQDESEQRDLLPTFETLLALTNLASLEDLSVHELQLRLAWDRIEDLLFSTNTLVQRAAVELVCNLMTSPSCVAKFADGSKDAKRRMSILLALADVDDLATRRAAGGALAMLTEWDSAVTALLDAKDGRGIEIILELCADDEEDIKHRGFVCLTNIISAPDAVGKRGVQEMKKNDRVSKLQGVLKQTKNPEVLRLGVVALKTLS